MTTADGSPRRIGIIGLGLLGTAVATRLLAGGHTVRGYDVRPEAITALREQGLQPAASAVAAAAADIAFTILPTPASVEEMWLGPGGLVETAARGVVLVQMSTIGVVLARRLGEAAARRGVRFLEAPVSGASATVAQGRATIFVGGDAELLATCRPILDAIAQRIVHVGPVGAASTAKLAANLIGGVTAIAVAEALVLGAKAGVTPAALLEALKQSPVSSGTLESRGALMVSGKFDPLIRLDLFLKDFRLMLDEGERLGVMLPLTTVAHQLCTTTSAAGHGDEDLAAVITTLQRLAGLGG
jgi:3-hydroxyisobutyrate dehydrogenase-like beta-hydroxyacid dehydrogenase